MPCGDYVFEKTFFSGRLKTIMRFGHFISIFFAMLVFVVVAGCEKSEAPAPLIQSEPSPDTIARIHWLGKSQLSYEAGAFYFMRLWKLPSSAQLEAQTLGRFSTALWKSLRTEPNSADASGALLLQSLFTDILQRESYLEIRHPANHSDEIVFAIRLNDAQAGRWETNFAAAMELTGNSVATQNGWLFQKRNVTNRVELVRAGEWTIAGTAQEKNSLLADVVARIRSDGVPFFPSGTNDWLDADFDPVQTVDFFGINLGLPKNLSRISLTVNGDGGSVFTRGKLTFARPLPVELEPWSFPTNLAHEPLIGFTAVRGIKSLVTSWEKANTLQIGEPSNQIYFWSLQNSPFQFYFAAPLPDAENQANNLSGFLLQKGNPWLASHGYVGVERAPDSNGVTWGNLSSMQPFIKSSDGWIFGGLLPDTDASDHRPPPAGMLQNILSRTNLVFYDWEITGARIQSCFYLDQTMHQILRRTPLPTDSAGAVWLNTLTSRLGSSVTVITRTAPNQLTFLRRSTMGLNSMELQLLVDWLESPGFPNDFYSLSAPVSSQN